MPTSVVIEKGAIDFLNNHGTQGILMVLCGIAVILFIAFVLLGGGKKWKL